MKIHEFLADSAKWTQRHYARDSRGQTTTPTEPDAVCWCILGAAEHLYYLENGETGGRLVFIRTAIDLGFNDLVVFNDTHTHAEVIAKLKELNL